MEEFKQNIKHIIIAIAFSLVIVLSFGLFKQHLKRSLTKISEQHLIQTSQLYAGTYKIKLNDQLSMLTSLANFFSSIDMTNHPQMMATIKSLKGIGDFKQIAVSDIHGHTINHEGIVISNLSEADYFKNVMKTGKPQISANLTTDETGDDVLALAVPIIQQGKPQGVITGTFSYSILNNILWVDTVDNGYTFVVSPEGNIIAASKSANRLCYGVSIAEFISPNIEKDVYEKVYNDVHRNITNIVEYQVGKSKRICAYTPVGVNDWYIFSIVPATYIDKQMKNIGLYFYVVFFIIVIFVLLLFHYGINFNKKYKSPQELEVLSKIAQDNHTLVFEYNLVKNTLELSGDTQFMFGPVKNSLSIDTVRQYYSLIHQDDVSVVDRIKQNLEEQNYNFTTEFRYHCNDGNYYWLRLSGSSLQDKNDQAIKFIGSIVNVDNEFLKESSFQNYTENDPLTGLLNRTFFEKKVNQYLINNMENSICAMFIIDLDNFQLLNNSLGHAMGDQVLKDTAQKLSLIFNEKDYMCRYTGDMFCVLMRLNSGISAETAYEVFKAKASSLNSLLSQEYYNNNKSVQMTASISIAVYPESGTNYKDLFHSADITMYNIKQSGKNNYAFFSKALFK